MNQDIPLGDVNFNDITRVMIECGSKVSSEDMVNLVEMKDIIFKLHVDKLGEQKLKLIIDSVAKTTNILNNLDITAMTDADKQHKYNSTKHLYNSVLYYTIFLTIKMKNDSALTEDAKRDFIPLVKEHWTSFCSCYE
tara:strand:- start:37 stop:447 length:411 start_codon:yes stop_codon:yes gene_type:complete